MGRISNRAGCVAALVLWLAAPAGARPRIGLVLAGGGAKGFAHIGVIQALEAAGVPIDVVVGTSMGAVVGGLYASGASGDELERSVREIDWASMFVDETPRRDLTIRRKTDEYGFLAKPRLRLRNGSPRFPRGVISGQKLMLRLRRLTQPAAGVHHFDALPIPYRAVAADLRTGEEVVLSDGDLPVAMRASMAVPGVFPPVAIGDHVLVDGGVVDNVPVSLARAMGADVVIVSAFVEPPVQGLETESALGVLGRTLDGMIRRKTLEEMSTLGPGDVLVLTDLGDIGSTSFDQAAEAIALGAAAARGQMERFRALAAPAEPRPRPVASLAGRPIRHIRIVQDTPLADDVLRARMHTEPGDKLDYDRLDQDAALIYGLDLFETVTWRVDAAGDGADVEIDARANPAGLNFARFGLQLATDFDRAATFDLGTSLTVSAVNRLNGEWRTQVELGRRYLLGTDFYQPFDTAARFFGGASLVFLDRGQGVFADREPVADARVLHLSGALRTGVNLGDDLTVAPLFQYGYGRVREAIGEIPTGPFRTANVGGAALYDNLDDLDFPRRGGYFVAVALHSLPSLGASTAYDTVQFRGNVALSAGRHTVVLGQFADLTVRGALEPAQTFELGGPFRLSGLLPGTLTDREALLSRLVYYFNLGRAGTPPLDFPFYVGGALEYGDVFPSLDRVDWGDMLWSGNAFLGFDAYIGPVYLGFGYTQGGSQAAFLSVGGLY